MANQKNFAIMPSVSISRSKFRRPSQHKTSFNLGDIIPIYVDADILPGDTVSLDLASLVRMSNPVAPLMDNIYIDYYAFFVPNRLVWTDWKKFMGENTSSYGAVTEPIYPTITISGSSIQVTTGSIGDYMGLPVLSVNDASAVRVSQLPGRAYYLCYNEWFRDQNLIAPISVTLSSGSSYLGTDPNNGGVNLSYASAPLKAAKFSDYFTRALPYAQKGSPVVLPLGTTADVKVLQNNYGTTNYSEVLLHAQAVTGTIESPTASSSGHEQLKFIADLSSATAATINQLRFAFQYQKFLEKDAMYGSRYWEILKGHFGVVAPDASLQRPEFLGHFRQNINIDQVLQTTGSNVSTPASNTLGIPGANSVSGKSEHLISKSFVEHGILMVLAVARHDQTYGQGVNRMWSRVHRSDYYFPVFANLGLQEVLRKEVYASASGNENVFGFQEAWAEYRYKPSIVTGLLNPSRANSMGYWTLSNNFAAAPTLSKSFIEQDRDNLQRSLVTGSLSGPVDFIADFYFDAVYVRPMPMYSVPGLIDHH